MSSIEETDRTRPARSGRAVRSARPMLALVAALALLAAACGSSSESSAPTIPQGDTTESADSSSDESQGSLSEEEIEAAQLRYQQCLADAGIDMSQEGESGAIELDASDQESLDAFEKCGEILDGVFGSFELSSEEEAAVADSDAVFESCMKEAGFDVAGDAVDIAEDQWEAFDEAAQTCGDKADEKLGDLAGTDGEDS